MAQWLYELDVRGRMAGLSLEETAEFRRLDASLPYDGAHVWAPET